VAALTEKRIKQNRVKRKRRVRGKVSGTETRPRLAVFRSARHIYVQAVADDLGRTLAEASTLNVELKESIAGKKKTEAAKAVGMLVSERLRSLGIARAVFDRGSYLYHGRVRALAEGAREGGLQF
jgi:large subunit ribosomal protein L18